MKFAFYTISFSPHQIPLAEAMMAYIGEDEYRYVSVRPMIFERRNIGWGDSDDMSWHIKEWKNQKCARQAVELSEVLMSGERDLSLLEERCHRGLTTFYSSERWFKPRIGMLRLFHPSYMRMTRRFVRLLRDAESFRFYPVGIHAARDMARLCGLMHGDWRCLFKAPELDFERKPGGRIWLKNGGTDKRYCLEKMRMWGYFVDSSKFRVEGLELGEDLGVRGQGSNKVRVLWVGRLLKLKRVDTIIRAVGECIKRRQVDSSLPEISLDVYGMGPEEKRLKKMAVRYGEAIKFHPPVPIEEVRNLMHKHDVYVLSSNAYEGWGAVVSEALEENMKVVGTYEAGASATILPESNLYPAGDWMKLADILVSDVKRTGIGSWTAESAAKVMLSLCGSGETGDMQ